MTTWWWVGHRRPASKRRSGPRLVSPGARHARGGGRPPHRRPRGVGVRPGGFIIQEQYLHRIRRKPTELCLQCSDTDCPAGRCPHGLRRGGGHPCPRAAGVSLPVRTAPPYAGKHRGNGERPQQWRRVGGLRRRLHGLQELLFSGYLTAPAVREGSSSNNNFPPATVWLWPVNSVAAGDWPGRVELRVMAWAGGVFTKDNWFPRHIPNLTEPDHNPNRSSFATTCGLRQHWTYSYSLHIRSP